MNELAEHEEYEKDVMSGISRDELCEALILYLICPVVEQCVFDAILVVHSLYSLNAAHSYCYYRVL